nr:hypothetical protein [uncultured Carboxylicivirga sp.]
MKYFEIEYLTGTIETGDSFPSVEFIKDYDTAAVDSVFKFEWGKTPDFIPNIIFGLAKGAKVCDILSQASIGSHGLLVNKKTLDVILKHSLTNPKVFPAYVSYKDKKLDYYWINLTLDSKQHILDWEASVFYYKRGLRNLGEVKIYSFQDYKEKNQSLDSMTFIKASKIRINKNNTYDFFPVEIGTNMIMSERLISNLIADNIIGLKYNEL